MPRLSFAAAAAAAAAGQGKTTTAVGLCWWVQQLPWVIDLGAASSSVLLECLLQLGWCTALPFVWG